jgi:uncharacterized protein (TIGR00661 family)
MQPVLSRKKILVAPLNWGLGHATRCMPVIDALLAAGAEVHLGGDGDSFRLLREAYPELPAHGLPSYNIQYPAGKGGAWKTLFKAPGIIKAIRKERLVVQQLAKELGFDIILSDNRYGAHTNEALSIFMCHQLRVLPPKGLRWAAPVIFKWHQHFFGNFDRVWIPDYANDFNLSGILSHGLSTGLPTDFIGPQSRFRGLASPTADGHYIAIVLSGPEPQRTLLEELLLDQAQTLDQPVVLVRGVVEPGDLIINGRIQIINYLHKEALFDLIARASLVICRPGYSTLMDLSQLGKKAILIPTPGQTEQEYLAENLADKNKAVLQRQTKLNLKEALVHLEIVQPIPSLQLDSDLLEVAIHKLAKLIQDRKAPPGI